MDMIDAIHTYYYNPFKYGSHIVSFYNSLEEVEQNILLLPLIIPICSHPELSKKLDIVRLSGKSRSSFFTKFGNPKELYDLQERIDALKQLSTQSLSYCMINDWVTVDELTLRIIANENCDQKQINQQAKNLGKLFSGLSITEIYKGLRVNP